MALRSGVNGAYLSMEPHVLTGHVNDLTLPGTDCIVLDLIPDAPGYEVRGIVATHDGQLLFVTCSGAAATLKHQSGSATAGNRLNLGGVDVGVTVDQGHCLIYDSASARWRIAG